MMLSIIRRWPKVAALARNSPSRSAPQRAWGQAKAASLQMKPQSFRWFAIRSSSSIAARRSAARGGAAMPAAASAASAKASACATVLSPERRAAKRAAARGDLPAISASVPLCE